jgi:transposase
MITGYQAGATVYELGRQFGVNRKAVSTILRRYGVSMRRQGLHSEQIEEAARLRAAGWTLDEVGNQLSVDARTVARRLHDVGQ